MQKTKNDALVIGYATEMVFFKSLPNCARNLIDNGRSVKSNWLAVKGMYICSICSVK